MLKTQEDITTTKKRLVIEVPAEQIEREMQKTLSEVRRRTILPGYRQGKAPMALIEKRYGKDVEGDVMERIIPDEYSKAVAETGMKPVAMPTLEGEVDFKRHEPLTLTFTVEHRPDIASLDYTGIEITRLSEDVTEDDLKESIERIRQDKATYEPTEEEIGEGDIVIVDYSAEGIGKELTDEIVRVGASYMPKDFSDALRGERKGEKLEFDAEFPENFHDKDLAGKKESVSLRVKEVKRVILPTLDDDFAKDLEFDNLDALKAHVREQLQKAKRRSAQRVMKAEVMAKLLDKASFDIPEVMLEEELKHLVSEAQFKAKDEDEADSKGEQELREELRPRAERQVRASIILQSVIDREAIVASEQEITSRVIELGAQTGLGPENIVKYYASRDGSLDGLRHQVLEDKAMEFILGKANMVETKEVSE